MFMTIIVYLRRPYTIVWVDSREIDVSSFILGAIIHLVRIRLFQEHLFSSGKRLLLLVHG